MRWLEGSERTGSVILYDRHDNPRSVLSGYARMVLVGLVAILVPTAGCLAFLAAEPIPPPGAVRPAPDGFAIVSEQTGCNEEDLGHYRKCFRRLQVTPVEGFDSSTIREVEDHYRGEGLDIVANGTIVAVTAWSGRG